MRRTITAPKITKKTSIETLRKDAKRWLKALRANDATARARLAEASPNAPAEPGLRDVQHAVAREYGQDNWIALKAAIDDLAVAREGHQARVERLLRHGWDGNPDQARRLLARYPELATDSLFTAATCGDVAAVERFLAADPDAAKAATGSLKWTALTCVTYGRLDAVNAVTIARMLIAAGADLNARFDDGWGSPFTVLCGAIRLGEGGRPSHPQVSELVELLIASGAEPYDHQTLYNVSIVGEDTYWYDVLWDYCAAQDKLEPWRVIGEGRLGAGMGRTTLDYLLGNAVGQNHLVRATWLLARGADANTPHAYSKQPVHAMAQLSGFLEMAKLLEAHGARPVKLTGREAFQAAVLRHDEAAARAVLATDPGLIRHPRALLSAAEFGDAVAVDLLLRLGADPFAADKDAITPLHRAVQSGSLAAVERLLAAGAEIDRRENRWGGSALTWSVVLKHPHLTAYLAPLSHDARAMAWCGLTGRLQALLAEDPARARERFDDGEAPSLLFCLPDDEAKAVEVTRLLLAAGADARVKNAKGQTAADAAQARELDEAADVMEAGHG